MADIEVLVRSYDYSDEEARVIAEGVRENLRTSAHSDLVPLWEDVLVLIRIAREEERTPSAPATPPPSPRAISNLVDQKVGLINRRLDSEAELGALSEWSQPAKDLNIALWPQGRQSFFRAPFIDKTARLVDIVELLKSTHWLTLLNALKLTPLVSDLSALSTEFDRALIAPLAPPAPTTSPARKVANEELRRQVCRIIGLFDTGSRAQTVERDRILEPLSRINQKVHDRWVATWAARRKKEEAKKSCEAPQGGAAQDAGDQVGQAAPAK